MERPSEIYWTAGFLNERFPAPVSPLGWSLLGSLFEEYALRDPLRFMGYPEANSIPATRLVRGHAYSNVLIFQIIYNPFPDALLPTDAFRYFPNGDVTCRKRAPYPRSILNPRFLLSLILHAARDPINVSPLNFWRWSRYARCHDARVAELSARLDQATSPCEILNVAARAYQAHTELLKIHRWSLTYADVFFKLLTRMVGERAQLLIADVPNLTWRMDEDLRALGVIAEKLALRFDSAESVEAALSDSRNSAFKNAYARLLAEHGHRSFSLDIAEPTFDEAPLQFLRLLSAPTNGVLSGNAAFAPSTSPFWQRPILTVLVALARRYAALREDQRSYWQKSLQVSRRAYLRLAQVLLARNVIDSPTHIFYATREEVDAFFEESLPASDLAGRIRARREQYSQYCEDYSKSPERSYPAFLRGDMPLDAASRDETPLDSQNAASRDAWRGRGVSPGRAEGAARVVLNPQELGRVARGDILIAPSTDPGWTPIFARLGGLVLERGGVLSHGAVVAREYRLPAVAAVPNITRELKDGDWIEVDGTRGVVRKLK